MITFHVDVAANKTVSDLKGAILDQNPNTLGNVDSHQLDLYKHYIKPSSNLKTRLDNIQLSHKDLLSPTAALSSTFHDASRGDIHVIGIVQTDDHQVKRKLAEDEERDFKRPHLARRWSVNGSIRQLDIPGCYYLDPGLQPSSTLCLTAVENSQFVLLSGARASGKSTRLLWLEVELGNMKYKPVYFSFEAIDYSGTVHQFWESIGSAIQRSLCYESLPPIVTRQTFFDAFQKKNWNQDVVLLIDEFSELHSASEDIRNDFLRALRDIRNNRKTYAIRSVIAAGTFSILLFTPAKSSSSPFNVSDHIENPYFTKEEVKILFKEFAEDNGITIEDAVIEDIYVKSNGHPGIVCLCGLTVYRNLQLLRNHSSTLSYRSWRRFPVKDLYHEVAGYPTFQSLAKSLMQPTAAASLGLFRSHFAGYLGKVELLDEQEVTLADFLTTEGVLLRPDGMKPIYQMASPLLDGYIRTSILPAIFSRTPSIVPPTKIKNNEATLDVLEVLKESGWGVIPCSSPKGECLRH